MSWLTASGRPLWCQECRQHLWWLFASRTDGPLPLRRRRQIGFASHRSDRQTSATVVRSAAGSATADGHVASGYIGRRAVRGLRHCMIDAGMTPAKSQAAGQFSVSGQTGYRHTCSSSPPRQTVNPHHMRHHRVDQHVVRGYIWILFRHFVQISRNMPSLTLSTLALCTKVTCLERSRFEGAPAIRSQQCRRRGAGRSRRPRGPTLGHCRLPVGATSLALSRTTTIERATSLGTPS